MGLREKLAELREEGLQDIKQSEDLKHAGKERPYYVSSSRHA